MSMRSFKQKLVDVCSVGVTEVLNGFPFHHVASLEDQVDKCLLFLHLFLIEKTEDCEVVFCDTPESFNAVERAAMRREEHCMEVLIQQGSVFLGYMCGGIVKHQDRLLAFHILTLDLLGHLEKELSEFHLVRGPARHEDWFVQAASDGTKDSNKHHLAVDRH